MAKPEQPVFRPEQVDEETVRTHFLEISGELAETMDLVGEIDFMDSPVIASRFDREAGLLAAIGENGGVSIHAMGTRGEAPRDLLHFDLDLGRIDYAYLGSPFDNERVAAVVTANRPGEVALVSLSEGGQYRNPEIISVLTPLSDSPVAEPERVTAIAMGEYETERNLAVAYGSDLLVHHLAGRPGRDGGRTRKEHERLTKWLAGDAERRGVEYEPTAYNDQHDIRTQRLEPWWHFRAPGKTPIIGLHFGSVYDRHGDAALFATFGSGRGVAVGVDFEHWPRASYGQGYAEHPWKPPTLRKFRNEIPSPVIVPTNTCQEKLLASESGLHLTYNRDEVEIPSSTIKLAAGREVSHVGGTIRHFVIATRETDGPGGTVTVIDRYPDWDRR